MASTQPPTVPDHRLLRLVGKGSYGEVWLARNAMGAWRAVKVVTRSDFESRRPFDREFEGIQRYEPLSRAGEGLVPILHVGLSPDGNNFYYVMELADGIKPLTAGAESAFDPADYTPRTLRSDLKEKGYLSIEDCVALGLSLVAGLNHLHKNGLIHRDVKPSNIVFIEGRAKLADLGLVGEIRRAQTFVGTEGYIPPEGPGHPAADLFALGKVLYEAATGFSPDEFPNPPAHWLNSPNQTSALELHEVILRACESDASQRYRNAAEMQADLALLQSGQSVRRAHRLERRVKRFRAIGIGAVVISVVAAGLGFFALYRAKTESENFRQANKLLHRAESAESRARSQLADAQLARAGLERLTRLAGHRSRSLELLREAAPFHTNKAELRSEVAAALALLDIRPIPRGAKVNLDVSLTVSNLVATDRDIVKVPSNNQAWVDSSLLHYAKTHEDSTIRLHGWEDDKEISTLEGASARSILGPFSSDSRLLAGQSGSHAFVWETSTGKQIYSNSVARLSGVDLTPDGQYVALWPTGQPIQLYRLADGQLSHTLDLGITTGQFWFSPDSRQVISLETGSCEIRRYSVSNGKLLGKLLLPAPACPRNLFWSPDSRGLFVTGNDFKGYFIRFNELNLPPIVLEGHTSEIVGVAFHPAKPYVITTCWDGFARIWDLTNGSLLIRFPGTGYSPRWSAHGRIAWNEKVITGRRLSEFQVFEPLCVQTFTEPMPGDFADRNKGPWHGTFLAGGEAFATASYDGVRIWPTSGDNGPLFFDIGPSRWLQLVSDGQQLWSSTARGLLSWNIDWNQNQNTLQLDWGRGRSDFPGEWALTPGITNNSVFTVSSRTVSLVETNSTRVIGRLKRPASVLERSPDGRLLLSTDPRNVPEYAITIWQRDPWKELRDIRFSGPAMAIFTPDNNSLIISHSGEIRRENRESGKVEWKYAQSAGQNVGLALAVSPDGQLIAFCSTPTEAALLNSRTGELLIKFRPAQSGLISSLAFSPDNRQLAVVTQNHFTHIWDLNALRPHLAALALDWHHSDAVTSKKHERPATIKLSDQTEAHDKDLALVQVSLARYFTHFVEGFSSASSRNFLSLKPGPLNSHGIEFNVSGIIQLGGISTEKTRARSIRGIRIGRMAKRLHFLHATIWNGDDGTQLARYIVNYANGKGETIPVIDGVNIHDWWVAPGKEPVGLPIAWRGSNSVAEPAGFQTALFHFEWTNPFPEEKILSIDLESLADRRVPFIAGITVETLESSRP